jgi:redox-sensitive bicupin YhaK (pirin superfamily)
MSASVRESRSVQRVVPTTRTLEGAGFVVRRPFPTTKLADVDPFLLLDHLGPFDAPPGEAKGAPDHPHRGFETVTYILEGELEHKDSVGNAGHLRAGDVQWMTAGAGVVHSEMPSANVQQNGGRIHGVQLWVNLPRAAKMTRPRYQEIPAARIPHATRDGVTVRVIAGEAYGESAVIETHTPILYFHASLAAGARFEERVPEGFTLMAYVLSGDVRAGSDERPVREGELAIFAPTGGAIALRAHAASEVLVIGGAPLREPVARYGPFVMSTQQEIVQAFEDYRAGRMGSIA